MSKYTAKFMTDEGGSSCFYILKESRTLGFKEFDSKTTANICYKNQLKLSKLGLAPKVYGKVCKIKMDCYDHFEYTGWGFITQIVKVKKRLSRKKIQELVDKIYKTTNLKFWDCHYFNIGIIKNKYVCIDTGLESFDEDCNAWGNIDPGPLCAYCNKFICNCWRY